VGKGNVRKGPSKDNVSRGNPKVRIFGKDKRTRSEYNRGIKGRGAREETREKTWRTFDRTARKIIRLEIERRIVRFAVGIKEMNNSAIWKTHPLPKRINMWSAA
jgi:hypothetical protein